MFSLIRIPSSYSELVRELKINYKRLTFLLSSPIIFLASDIIASSHRQSGKVERKRVSVRRRRRHPFDPAAVGPTTSTSLTFLPPSEDSKREQAREREGGALCAACISMIHVSPNAAEGKYVCELGVGLDKVR